MQSLLSLSTHLVNNNGVLCCQIKQSNDTLVELDFPEDCVILQILQPVHGIIKLHCQYLLEPVR